MVEAPGCGALLDILARWQRELGRCIMDHGKRSTGSVSTYLITMVFGGFGDANSGCSSHPNSRVNLLVDGNITLLTSASARSLDGIVENLV
jgi:hypothetical protein